MNVSIPDASVQVVWLKRDLRFSDHEPMRKALEQSEQWGKVLVLYIHEPTLIAQPDFSAQHSCYIRETLNELKEHAHQFGARLIERVGDACEILELLHRSVGISVLRSHRETGHKASYQRDNAVLQWCRINGVPWVEERQNGLLRGSETRKEKFDFEAYLEATARTPLWQANVHSGWASWPDETVSQVPVGAGEDKPRRLRGGRTRALKLADAFFEPQRIRAYPYSISSPLKAVKGCSLLSAALSHGVVSDREIIQTLYRQITTNRSIGADRQAFDKGVYAYIQRLCWRASYLQCFENFIYTEHEPDIGTEISSESMSEHYGIRLKAWREGCTGVPMVDASMRMLAHIGWLNMRMRGLVSSFAVGVLGLHWRDVGLHLAREFLDYEPAIHWNQMQIHSGVSRLSTPMSYNPVKQAQDHDPEGIFVKRWVPELASVPKEHLAQPGRMTSAEQVQYNVTLGQEYPNPIVDMTTAMSLSRDRLFGPRKKLKQRMNE